MKLLLIFIMINIINAYSDKDIKTKTPIISEIKDNFDNIKNCNNSVCYIENTVRLIFISIVSLAVCILYLFIEFISFYLRIYYSRYL